MNIPIKTPKTMAMSFINDSFINGRLTMEERKKQCREIITSYIGSKELDDWSTEYWMAVAEEIEKL